MMKPGQWGRGPNGKPAIQWWRYGVAAAGEPSVVTEVREYETERDRFLAFNCEGAPQQAPDSARSGFRGPGSWMIVRRDNGAVVTELFAAQHVALLNWSVYDAVPAAEYLASLNRRVGRQPAAQQESGEQVRPRQRG